MLSSVCRTISSSKLKTTNNSYEFNAAKMLEKWFALLVVLLIVQLCYCHPSIKEANSTDSEMCFQALKRFKTLEIENIMNYTVVQGQQLFKKILQKAERVQPKGELLEQHLEKLSTFVKDVELLRYLEPSDLKSSGIQFFASRGAELCIDFEAEAKSTPADFPHQLLPNENGLSELKEGVKNRMREFVEKFTLKLGEAVAGMTSEERLIQKETVDWYEKYGGENLDKRVAHFFDIK